MRLFCSIFFIFSFGYLTTQAQQIIVTGKVIDAKDSSPLIGASVFLFKKTDTTKWIGVSTDINGAFQFAKIASDEYLFRVTYIGYTTYQHTIRISDSSIDLGEVKMKIDATLLKEIKVEGDMIRQQQKGDTTEYNANAFKTNPDANAEDLVKKMPGITVENGTVKAQGEDVKKVLIDGKEFFGDDANIALRNLPADLIDRIQVFDRLSDQSQFTGFDDGNSQKTINIVTRSSRLNGQFGKLYAGYGTNNQYSVGGNLNFFNKAQRISLVGMSNSINQQNFSSQDIVGLTGSQGSGRQMGGAVPGAGRGGMGSGNDASNFMVDQQNGITRTSAIGINYVDNWSKKINVTGSYFFNSTATTTNYDLQRTYFTTSIGDQLYDQNQDALNKSMNHRFNLRLEYTIDSLNSMIFTPKLSLQSANSNKTTDANSMLNTNLLNTTYNFNDAAILGYSMGSGILYRHKFKKTGRTLSLNLTGDLTPKKGDTHLESSNHYYDKADILIQLKQQGNTDNRSYTLSSTVAYTEPITKKSILQFTYSYNYSTNKSSKNIFNYNLATDEYSIIDTTLTNQFDNLYITQRGGIGYRFRGEKSTGMVGLNGQLAVLSGDQFFPTAFQVNKSFMNLLPNLMWQYKFTKTTSLRLMYRTATNAPSINQLQPVIDNTNPLLLTTGNSDLKQSYNHTLILRYGKTSLETARSFFAFVMVGYTDNYITNSTFIASRDTLLSDRVTLYKGSQLNKPVNLPAYMNARSFFTYVLPLKVIKSNLNLNAGLNYTSSPGLINGSLNRSSTYTINGGGSIVSTLSEKIDFTLSYNGNYAIVKNTITAQTNNNYFYQIAGGKFNWLIGSSFVINTDLNYTKYTGLGSGFNQQFILWNAAIGYKFLKNKAAEFRISVFDLLNQNRSITRNVTETYIEDVHTRALNRYVLFTFIYTIKKFNLNPSSGN